MEAGDDCCGYWRRRRAVHVCGGGTRRRSGKSVCDRDRCKTAGGVEGRGGETQAGERDRGGEQRGGYESAGGLLRRDFFKARVPSPDKAGGVRCEPGAVLEARRAAAG